MRSINASSTSGAGGICTAVYEWWLAKSSVIARIQDVAERVGTCKFHNLVSTEVGKVLIREAGLWEEFNRDLEANPDVLFIARLGEAQKKQNFFDDVSGPLGNALKETSWWAANLKEIQRNKRQLKAVMEVLES